jgi:ATP-dependent Lhr-like helicase
MMLETYREILRDHFDMPGLVEVLRQVGTRARRVTTIDSKQPSPFAASLLFSYVANYIYDGDAPLAERRAQALSVDQAQLRELLGDAELRDLLDPDALEATERRLQQLDDSYKARSADGIHDLLLRIGDLTIEEIQARATFAAAGAVAELARERRIVPLPIAGQPRYVAVEDVARYRDALGVPLPLGLPESLLEPVRDAVGDLVLRFARSHAPFTAGQLAARYGLGTAVVTSVLQRLTEAERLIEGEFRPGGTEREWVDANVLRTLRSRSLARLRHEVEAVEGDALGRFMMAWHGIGSKRRGLEALLDAIEQLQGTAIPASVLERDILPVRVDDYAPAMLDTLMAAGEVVWVGVERLGEKDGRIALYLTDHLTRLRPPVTTPPTLDGRVKGVRDYLAAHGASFFAAIREGTGQGFPTDTVEALWELVWMGLVTNDTLHPLRTYTGAGESRRVRRPSPSKFRSRRSSPRTSEGRWSLVETAAATTTPTEWGAATAHQLLARHGIVTRETVAAEAIAGGFSAVYQVLRAMEDAGRIRRGYFVTGLGGAQFAMPAALDLLRSHREPAEAPQAFVLAATDPANPYGTLLKWPEANAGADRTPADLGRGATRTVGTLVVLVDGLAAGYLRRGERDLLLALPDAEPARGRVAQALVRALIQLALARPEGQRGMFLETINGVRAGQHPAARWFVAEGFALGADGLQYRAPRGMPGGAAEALREEA